MEPANWIALAGILIAPLAALAGAGVNGYLPNRARVEEQLEHRRTDAAAALGPMVGLLLDATPSLVLGGELREYADPASAVRGLYDRWLKAREVLLVVCFAQPSSDIRDMGINLQAQAELLLRQLSNDDPGADETHRKALGLAGDLAQRLSPLPGSAQGT